MFATGRPFQLWVMEQSNLLGRFVSYEANGMLSIHYQSIKVRLHEKAYFCRECFGILNFSFRISKTIFLSLFIPDISGGIQSPDLKNVGQLLYHFATSGHCYKTLYSRKLRLFIISESIWPWSGLGLVQPSLMFAGKARDYLSEAPFRGSSLK